MNKKTNNDERTLNRIWLCIWGAVMITGIISVLCGAYWHALTAIAGAGMWLGCFVNEIIEKNKEEKK